MLSPHGGYQYLALQTINQTIQIVCKLELRNNSNAGIASSYLPIVSSSIASLCWYAYSPSSLACSSASSCGKSSESQTRRRAWHRLPPPTLGGSTEKNSSCVLQPCAPPTPGPPMVDRELLTAVPGRGTVDPLHLARSLVQAKPNRDTSNPLNDAHVASAMAVPNFIKPAATPTSSPSASSCTICSNNGITPGPTFGTNPVVRVLVPKR